MARQMGLKPEDLKDVDGMWRNLDDLSESDPEAYQKLIEETIAQGPPKPTRGFRPKPGFVVKLLTQSDGGTGMRVRTPNGDGGSKMFVNISSHEALDQPKDQFGRPVQPGERRNAEGLTMPLLVGKPRRCADHSGETKAMALDVVFHPWVIERCDLDNTFKAQVIELALNWIEQETHYKLLRGWKTIRSKYKGGSGPDQDQPVIFPIEEAMLQGEPPEKRPSKPAPTEAPETPAAPPKAPEFSITSPESLLAAKAKVERDLEAAPADLDRTGGARNSSKAATPFSDAGITAVQQPPKPAKGALIQDITDGEPKQTRSTPDDAANPPQGKKKGKPAVKKGFLKSTERAALYEEGGSNEGGKEGSYSRFMSKCKVVDMSSMSPEEQQQRMKQHAAGGPAPAAPRSNQAPQVPAPSAPSPQSSFDGLGKGFLGGNQLYGQDGSPEGTGTRVGTDALLDELMGGMDPEFAEALKPVEDQETKDMYDTLGDIAKVLGSTPMGNEPIRSMNQSSAQSTAEPPRRTAPQDSATMVNHTAAGQSSAEDALSPPPPYKLDLSKDAGTQEARVCVDMSAVPAGMKNVDLEVGGSIDAVNGSTLRLLVPGKGPLLVPLPFEADPSCITAKFSKKRGKLDVKVLGVTK